MSEVRISQITAPVYYPFIHDVFHHGHTHYDLAGGRGSLKSSVVSEIIPLLMMMDDRYNAIVFRKVGNTLRTSVFAQYLWALDKLGMADKWKHTTSPMELTYKETGQKILFFGLDDFGKMKSLKMPHGYVAITHFEEKDQFAGRAEIRGVNQSTMRGGDKFWNFETYNPPKTRDNWANIDSKIVRPDRLCLHTTYLDAPREWLGEQFLYEAELLKQTDEISYRHEYLGEATGTGGSVFEKIEVRDIQDDEVRSFDKIYQGVDFGYFPDPFVFIRLYYDRAREKIYFIDEIVVNKKSNDETIRMIKEKNYNDFAITCDSAEPKSVADFRSGGLRATGAIKGAGSVEYGMKWLMKRTLVIDPRRTPTAWREFTGYEYERNKLGEIISGYPDVNNHTIDATRYALEHIIRMHGSRA